MIRYLIAGIGIIVLCSSCNKSPVATALSESDSLVVQFFNEKEVLENAATTTEKDAIEKIARFVGTGRQDSVDCAKGGQLVFYSAGKETQRVLWKPECRQFEFVFESKKQFTGMSKEAVDFITDIRNAER